ncbi:MAG: hypothetical protein NTW42_11220 [Deltaproteobacteria bacterium]|nr:hypothetical protein [Deltaproteobacteria bacterium]
MFEFLFQFVGEVLLQIAFEALFEVGLRTVREPFKKPPNPWLAAMGYALFGASAGALSLWVFPMLFIVTRSAQIASLLLTPFAAGGAMAALGAWRRRREQITIRLDTFAYGYLFALAMTIVRFIFGQ